MAAEVRVGTAVAAAPIDRLDGRPLTVLLHGLGSHERDLLPLAAALPDDAVVALRAPVPYGPGFSWAPADRWEDVVAGTALDAAADAVLAFVAELTADRGAPREVRLLGFSQGGAVALTALRRAPEAVGRVVLLAGFVPSAAERGDTALAVGRPPVFWGRGDADPVIPEEAIGRTDAWLAAHTTAVVRVYPGLGHGVSDGELADVAAFLA